MPHECASYPIVRRNSKQPVPYNPNRNPELNPDPEVCACCGRAQAPVGTKLCARRACMLNFNLAQSAQTYLYPYALIRTLALARILGARGRQGAVTRLRRSVFRWRFSKKTGNKKKIGRPKGQALAK